MIQLLQFVFYQKAVSFGSDAVRLNYVFRDYSPNYRQIVLEAPQVANPSYIFLHAYQKINDLSIYGDFGDVNETGLIWNQPYLQLSNVLLEMKTTNKTVFFIARWTYKVVMRSSYIDVGAAIVSINVFKAFSMTDTSLIGQYVIHNNVPYTSFIKGDALFTKETRLDLLPVYYVEPCQTCAMAATGAGCSLCIASTFLDAGECKCQYHNYAYSMYEDNCVGIPDNSSTIINETIYGVETGYFAACTNNHAFFVNYTNTYISVPRISFFRDDSCGINNVYLTGNMTTTPRNERTLELVGVVYTKTTSLANSTFNLTLINSYTKLKSLTLFAKNATSNIVLSNLMIRGIANDGSYNRNPDSEFRVNILFHSLNNAVLDVYALTIHNSAVQSYYDGVYNAIGIGAAMNSTLNFFDTYIGDSLPENVNPLVNFDLTQDFTPDVDCSDMMNGSHYKELLLYQKLPMYLGSTSTFLKCDAANLGGLLGLLQDSTVMINKSLISVHAQSYFGSMNFGLLATTFERSALTTQLTTLHMLSATRGFGGVIGRMNGVSSQVKLSASVNLTSENLGAGLVAYFEAGILRISVYLKMSMTGGTCGGVCGHMSGGNVIIDAAFGSVKASGSQSGNVVGYWIGGELCNQTCQSGPCRPDEINTSYINVPSVDGVCTPVTQSGEPIGNPGSMYFMECRQDAKVKLVWSGSLQFGSLTIFNPLSNCPMTNLNVTGRLTVQYTTSFSFGIVLQNNNPAQNIYMDMQLQFTGYELYRIGLVAATSLTGNFERVILKNRMSCTGNRATGHISGFIAYSGQSFNVIDLAIYGMQLNVSHAMYCALVVGQQYYRTNYTNILIDDYSKEIEVPSFDVAQELPADFRCAANVQDSNLQKSLYMASLLTRGQPTRRSGIKVLNDGKYVGALVAHVYDRTNVTNVSIIAENDIASPDQQCGLFLGYAYYPMNVSTTYVEGTTYKKDSGIIGLIYDVVNIEMASKYVANGQNSGFIRYFSYGVCTYKVALDVTLNADNCGGFFYSLTAYNYYVIKAYGTVIKNGNNCYSAIYSQAADTMPNAIFTNDAVCPAW